MQTYNNSIEPVNLEKIDNTMFSCAFAAAIVLTKDRKILLQLRADDSRSFPGCISTFGGRIEDGETPIQSLIRELREELGAEAIESEVISFGVITEAITNYTELVYVYFWHDHSGTITGCYEGSPLLYDNAEQIIKNPKVMDYVIWLLDRCTNMGLL